MMVKVVEAVSVDVTTCCIKFIPKVLFANIAGKWVGVGIGVTLIIVIIAAVIVGIVLMWMKRGKSVEVEKTGGQPEGSFGYSKQEDDVTHMGFGTVVVNGKRL